MDSRASRGDNSAEHRGAPLGISVQEGRERGTRQSPSPPVATRYADSSFVKSWSAGSLSPRHPISVLIADLPATVEIGDLLARASEWAHLLRLLPGGCRD